MPEKLYYMFNCAFLHNFFASKVLGLKDRIVEVAKTQMVGELESGAVLDMCCM